MIMILNLQTSRMKLPDSPQTPKFLQIIQWIFNPLQLMEKCKNSHGDCFTLWLAGNRPTVFFSDPQAIQEIFAIPSEKFDTGRGNGLLRPLLGVQSLILLDGAPHQRQRRLLTPPFHGERMKTYGEMIENISNQVISNWKIGEAFSVRYSMQEISLRVILKAVFGLNEGERFVKLKQLLASILDLSGSPLRTTLMFFPTLQQDLGAWSPWGKFLRQKQQIDQLIYAEIEQRRKYPDAKSDDILSLMMSARYENGESMSNEELRDDLMTLLVAGHETTASALTWALYWIHRLPEVRQKLLVELDAVSEKGDFNEISRLPYLSAVCQETLRIYPIAMIAFPRLINTPIKIMGDEFGVGTSVVACIYLTHHRQDLYPESKQFKPERFLERQYSPYEYLPFGGGDRRCLGMAFAMYEMKLVLATVLSRWDLGLVANQSVKPMRRGATLAPSGGKWLVANLQR